MEKTFHYTFRYFDLENVSAVKAFYCKGLVVPVVLI